MMAALLDHLWQSTLFAAIIALVMPLFRHQAASLRFWLWFAASMKFLVPFAVLVALGHHLVGVLTPAVAAPLLTAIRPAVASFTLAAPLMMPAPAHIPAAELAVIVWAVGLVAIVLLGLSGWLDLRASLREAGPAEVDAPVPVKLAATLLEPGLVGIWRPVILLPQGLAQQLTQAEIDAVLAHELCHLRRRDNLLAALHMLVEGLFWFHPLVWWIGGRLIEERERACDESVVAGGIRPMIYAEGILKICRFYVQSPLACTSGVSGADLQMRLDAILADDGCEYLGGGRRMLLAGMAMLTLLLPLTAGMLGSAPVSRLAAHVAAVLEAPRPVLLPPQMNPPAPVHKPTRIHRIAMSSSAPPDVQPVVQGPIPAAMTAPRVAAVDIGRFVAIIPKLEGDVPEPVSKDQSLVCRRGETFSTSRLKGPSVCRTAAQWAELKAKHQDIGPDGHSLISTNYDQEHAHNSCHSIQMLSPTQPWNGGIALCY